ncbi:Cpe/LpqF family protein [Leucobacter sp. NPDC015123]|uniref:Cpe/LpqF family protein n=1 Tax=Leucobacter sp. NPDC015123 TaxID=3364129 RepID=UPI000E648F58
MPAPALSSSTLAQHLNARSQRRRFGAAVAAVAVAAGLLTACTSPSSAPEPSDPAGVVAIPDTAAAGQIEWALGLLNADTDITVDQLEGRFTKEFLAQVPAEDLAAQLNEGVRPLKPFKTTDYADVSEVVGAARITAANAESFSLEVRVEPDGTISEMLIRPAGK